MNKNQVEVSETSPETSSNKNLESKSPELAHNRLRLGRTISQDPDISFLSLPWSYLSASLAWIIIGILDFILLGHLIGHPEDPTVGEYIGQGNAVFLGGVSFFYTVGLLPLLIGIILLLYSLLSIKRVHMSKKNKLWAVIEQRGLFSTRTEVDSRNITRISLSNRGVKFRHSWILIFVPMAITILKFGIPLFGEHLAEDEILPTMMVITAFIDLIVVICLLVIPNFHIILESSTHQFRLVFFPGRNKKKIINKIKRLFHLEITDQHFSDSNQSKEHSNGIALNLHQIGRSNNIRILLGIFILIPSILGAILEIIWGSALTLVGFTYGIYLILRGCLYGRPKFTKIVTESKESKIKIAQGNSLAQEVEMSVNPNRDELALDSHMRILTLIDIVGITGLIYFATLEIIWGWQYIPEFNWLTTMDMIISTIIWILLLYGVGLLVFGIIDGVSIGSNILEINHSTSYNLKSQILQAFQTQKHKPQMYYRITGLIIIFILVLIIAFF